MSEAASLERGDDIRPLVAQKSSNRAIWLFGVALAIGAGTLFASLNSRRTEISSPAIMAPENADSALIASPPSLVIPPFHSVHESGELERPINRLDNAERFPGRPAGQRQIANVPSPGRAPQQTIRPIRVEVPPSSQSNGDLRSAARPDPDLAYLSRQSPPNPVTSSIDGDDKERRAYASRFRNPSTTVPQGTVIQAVLETALNSNHPGFARAVVSRSVHAFDGSRILIPKGSKLFGEYAGEVSRGQNRALIRWRRLTRPDGTIIDVDSPSADPLGRAGVKGKVDSHFFARFGGTILQSALDLGVRLGSREVVGDAVIVALPNSSPQITTSQTEQVQPTIKVKNGTSVSVFVMRDLDFTDVEQ